MSAGFPTAFAGGDDDPYESAPSTDDVLRDLRDPDDVDRRVAALDILLNRSGSPSGVRELIEEGVIPALVDMYCPDSSWEIYRRYSDLIQRIADLYDSHPEFHRLGFGERVVRHLVALDANTLGQQRERLAPNQKPVGEYLVRRVGTDCFRLLIALWAGDRSISRDRSIPRAWINSELIRFCVAIVEAHQPGPVPWATASAGNAPSSASFSKESPVFSQALRMITVLRSHPDCQTNGIATDDCVRMAVRVLRSFHGLEDRWRAMSILNNFRVLTPTLVPNFKTSVCRLECFSDYRNDEFSIPKEYHAMQEGNCRMFCWQGNLMVVQTAALAISVGTRLTGVSASAALEEMGGDAFKQARAAYVAANRASIQYGTAHMIPAGDFTCLQHVILTVIGSYSEANKVESENILHSAWRSVFDIVIREKISSITLPLIGGGAAGYPPAMAIQTAVHAIRETFRLPDAQDVGLKVVLLDLKGDLLKMFDEAQSAVQDRH